MTNTQRNTTVIGIVLALVVGSGYYFANRLTKQKNLIDGKNKDLTAEIEKLDKMLAQRAEIERSFEELKLMISLQSKVLAQTDTPAMTYNYFLQLLKWMKKNINYDFSLSSKKAADSNWNEYIVSGKSDFIVATNFIKNLEYQRPLLTIEDVTVAEYMPHVCDTVQFSLVLKTHFSPDGAEIGTVKEKEVKPYSSSYVSFRPKIYDNPPETDIDPNLVRIDKALIVGITETRAFLRDERGIIHILAVGDPVAYGYLYSIDPKQEKIVFRLNQYGSTEDKTLFMQKTK